VTIRRLELAAVILLCALSTGGQQKDECAPGSPYQSGCYEKIVQKIPTADGKTGYLSRVADSLHAEIDGLQAQVNPLQAQVAALQTQAATTGTFQISAVTFYLGPNDPWTAVFRVNTRTGLVCQVLGSNSRKGELLGGSSIPTCAN
jgi:hypothetical protein